MRDSPGAELRRKFQSFLQERGLTVEDARKLKLDLYTRERARSELPNLPAHFAGFRIPYFDFTGRVNGGYRFRYLEVIGFAALTSKPWRYASPKGSKLDLYLPPFIDWVKWASDPSKPGIITEGEIKAAIATKTVMPTIGLGGVWCFRSAARGMSLLPAFGEIEWPDRRVYIAYDSDAATNPDVVRAENQLAKELLRLGAFPYIVRLPALEK